ncbi:hypothetical protein BDZ97DRAFT_1752493 [Flammula alnicola]|nr:hypothetical protein BDZ97DRAFT_1752493 [Flammula alnicola]
MYWYLPFLIWGWLFLNISSLFGILEDTPALQQSLPSVGIYSSTIDRCDQMVSTVFSGLDEHVSCICIPLHIAEYNPLSGKDHMPSTPNVSSKYCPTVGELYIYEDYMVWAFDHASRMLCLWVARVALLDIYRVSNFQLQDHMRDRIYGLVWHIKMFMARYTMRRHDFHGIVTGMRLNRSVNWSASDVKSIFQWQKHCLPFRRQVFTEEMFDVDEEMSDSNKETTGVDEEPLDVDEELSESNKETTGVDEEPLDVDEELSDSNKEATSVDEDTLDVDTLGVDEEMFDIDDEEVPSIYRQSKVKNWPTLSYSQQM